MKISVITASFNQGRFIEDAIQSVLEQNYPDFEHIIIDGGSTDDTIERLKKYPHLNWISEKDDGQSDALNKGFAKATGDVIGWLNSDDFYLPGVFEKVSAELSGEKVHGVYGNINICDVNKNITRQLKTHRVFKFFTVFHGYIPSESLFIKRVIIDNDIIIDKDFHISMDKEFIAHIVSKRYKLKHIKQTFACFRIHEDNKSLNTRKTQLQVAKEGLIILNRYWKWNVPVNQFTIKMYKGVSRGLMPVRKILKMVFN